MKRLAFTMIELVFVIVVIGIISAVMIPRMDRDSLSEAAIQLASHIRYTQHLAMVDDKYVPNIALSSSGLSREVEYWYKGRWQLVFHKRTGGTVCVAGGNKHWSYSIFSDGPGRTTGYTGNPDETELAVNPLDKDKLLSGGYTTSSGVVSCQDPKATKEMNLGYKYNIEEVALSGGCAVSDSRNQRIAFDHLGRPMYDKLNNLTSPYLKGVTNLLVKTQCIISLCSVSPCSGASSNEIVQIAIEAETGYTHIL